MLNEDTIETLTLEMYCNNVHYQNSDDYNYLLNSNLNIYFNSVKADGVNDTIIHSRILDNTINYLNKKTRR